MNNIKDILSGFDCWDLGGGANSIEWMKDAFSVQSPVAINPGDNYGRIDALKNEGYPVLQLSALEIPEDAHTNIISMFHMLEHLPSEQAAVDLVKRALHQAEKFVVIAGPFFESDVKLRKHEGLKFNWADWDDHALKFSLTQIEDVLEACGLWTTDYSVSLGFPATHSSDVNIFSVDEARNQGDYDPAIHLPKPHKDLKRNYFKEFMVVIPRDARISYGALDYYHTKRHGPKSMLN